MTSPGVHVHATVVPLELDSPDVSGSDVAGDIVVPVDDGSVDVIGSVVGPGSVTVAGPVLVPVVPDTIAVALPSSLVVPAVVSTPDVGVVVGSDDGFDPGVRLEAEVSDTVSRVSSSPHAASPRIDTTTATGRIKRMVRPYPDPTPAHKRSPATLHR
jgi:hypothetical protein